jgi:hypothetical protein
MVRRPILKADISFIAIHAYYADARGSSIARRRAYNSPAEGLSSPYRKHDPGRRLRLRDPCAPAYTVEPDHGTQPTLFAASYRLDESGGGRERQLYI